VTQVDKKNRKIALSIKQREIDEEKEAMAEYGSADTGASLGEILGPAMRSAVKEAATDEDEGKSGSAAKKSGGSKSKKSSEES
jgi:small subunit ribosomal protein S1